MVYHFSKLKRSKDQVIKSISVESLSNWVGHLPVDVVQDMSSIAPMLSVLGYDPKGNPPNYGKPDDFVINKMKDINLNRKQWEDKENELMKLRQSIKNDLIKQKQLAKSLSKEKLDNQIDQIV